MTTQTMVARIKRAAMDAGYVDWGISSAEPFAEFARVIDRRKEHFPGAASLYEPLRAHAFPRENNPWANSIVVCVRWYGKYRIPEGISPGIGRNYLFDRRYKECPDHEMPDRMEAGLRALGLRVEAGGVPDRWAAARAGVARFGRNNFAYTPDHGSWINISSWLVDAQLPPDEPTYELACPDTCRRCVDACPTDALEGPLCMRWDRCVAHLTYSASEPIQQDLWEQMGRWVYGCDECQLLCPLNRGKWQEKETATWLEKIAPLLSNKALATMDEPTFRSVVQPAFWYIPPEGVERWRRNARRALRKSHGNGSGV